MSPFDGKAAQCDNFTRGKTASSRYNLSPDSQQTSFLLAGVRFLSVLSSSFTCSDQDSFRSNMLAHIGQLTPCRVKE